MATTGMKLTKNWKRFRKTVDPKNFDEEARKHMKRASILNGNAFVRKARKMIREKRYAPNAPLTIGLKKGSKTPLINNANLRNAITSVAVSDVKIFVGILRADENFNTAVVLHEGATIGVTPKMRALFQILWLADRNALIRSELHGRAKELYDAGEGRVVWRRLKPGTTVIVIKPRRFLKEPFEDADTRKLIRDNWTKGYQAALRSLARRA